MKRLSPLWQHQGVKRIWIVLLVLYSVLMLVPFGDTPGSHIFKQVTLKHCIGADEYKEELRLDRAERLVSLNKEIQDKASDMYQCLNGFKPAPNGYKGMPSRIELILREIDMGWLDYDSQLNSLKYNANYFRASSYQDQRYAESTFKTQLTLIRWIWLLTNYFFWGVLIIIVVEIGLWINRGFNQADNNE